MNCSCLLRHRSCATASTGCHARPLSLLKFASPPGDSYFEEQKERSGRALYRGPSYGLRGACAPNSTGRRLSKQGVDSVHQCDRFLRFAVWVDLRLLTKGTYGNSAAEAPIPQLASDRKFARLWPTRNIPVPTCVEYVSARTDSGGVKMTQEDWDFYVDNACSTGEHALARVGFRDILVEYTNYIAAGGKFRTSTCPNFRNTG